MPVYDWVDKNSKKPAMVLRPFAQYKEAPTKEEALEEGLTEEEADNADWERNIAGGIQIVRSPEWGGKGHW